mgnify:CR=1 FL=1|tara:strand:- start:6469 stop:7227 length:759 start_codon:yes stop_codon:yes gene_type:complete
MGFFGFGGKTPTLFNRSKSNAECCDAPNDNILNCADVLACVNSDFQLNLKEPYIPYWDGTGFSSSPLSVLVDDVILPRGSSFVSQNPGLAEFGFGASGDTFEWSTDSYLGNGGTMFLRPDEFLVSVTGFNPGSFALTATQATIFNTTKIVLDAPLIEVIDGGKLDSAVLNGIFDMFDTNASIVSMGKNGGTFKMRSTLTMAAAQLQLSAGAAGYASMTMPAGVAPAAPANGDMWFDGTNLYIRIAGASTIIV